MIVDWLLVGFIAYAFVGFLVFLYLAVLGWQTGNAVYFLLYSFAGILLGAWWLLASILFCAGSIIVWLVQSLMNRMNPNRDYLIKAREAEWKRIHSADAELELLKLNGDSVAILAKQLGQML